MNNMLVTKRKSIEEVFKDKKAFISFVTAGDPTIEKTYDYIIAMAKAGSDLVEIGIPFSDPIAEGETIERANSRALKVGTTTDKVFEMVDRVREVTGIPLVFLTYINPVFVYGKEKFFKRCKECGIDGIIIPDLPFEERNEVLDIANKNDVTIITLIAPTSKERIQTLAKDAKGFIYLVSSMGVTGVRDEIQTDLNQMICEVKKASTTPIAVGFGISRTDQAREISKKADGVIVGSAIVKIIEEHGENAEQYIFDYVKSMVEAITIF